MYYLALLVLALLGGCDPIVLEDQSRIGLESKEARIALRSRLDEVGIGTRIEGNWIIYDPENHKAVLAELDFLRRQGSATLPDISASIEEQKQLGPRELQEALLRGVLGSKLPYAQRSTPLPWETYTLPSPKALSSVFNDVEHIAYPNSGELVTVQATRAFDSGRDCSNHWKLVRQLIEPLVPLKYQRRGDIWDFASADGTIVSRLSCVLVTVGSPIHKLELEVTHLELFRKLNAYTDKWIQTSSK